jgi:hypothetical protein
MIFYLVTIFVVLLVGAEVSHPVFRSKPDTHHMYGQYQVVIHTAIM